MKNQSPAGYKLEHRKHYCTSRQNRIDFRPTCVWWGLVGLMTRLRHCWLSSGKTEPNFPQENWIWDRKGSDSEQGKFGIGQGELQVGTRRVAGRDRESCRSGQRQLFHGSHFGVLCRNALFSELTSNSRVSEFKFYHVRWAFHLYCIM